MFEKLKYWIWMSSVPGMGAKKKYDLVNHFGDPVNIWNSSKRELMDVPFLTEENVNALLDRNKRSETMGIMDALYRNGIKAITIKDPEYPDCLRNIYDPPIVLYYKGRLEIRQLSIAVVGSRRATYYGKSVAERISAELAAYGINVVSGMARGIDSSAHRGALKGGGRTIGVMGCGLDIVYPPENKELAERITESGALVSEYVPGTAPLPANFPARNRIISGISQGVLVVEAGEKSGSLITVGYALEQGREVFAVPGNINSISSAGTNRLIKEGARLVTSAEDILEEFNLIDNLNQKKEGERVKTVQKSIFSALDEKERMIAECLLEGPMHIDLLVRQCKMEMQSLNTTLVMMELKGLVEMLPGKHYRLRI